MGARTFIYADPDKDVLGRRPDAEGRRPRSLPPASGRFSNHEKENTMNPQEQKKPADTRPAYQPQGKDVAGQKPRPEQGKEESRKSAEKGAC